MEVIYAVGAPLAKGWIGSLAYHALGAINKRGYLKKVITIGKGEVELGKNKIANIFYPKRIRLPYVNAKRWYYLRNLYFDRRVRNFLKEGCDIFHGWNSQCLSSLNEAIEEIKTRLHLPLETFTNNSKLLKEHSEQTKLRSFV